MTAESGQVDVSILVVAWNVRDLVRDCLESVFKETRDISFEVIYVDNASEDGSVEMVRSDFPDVRVIENDENLGFIKANNQAIRVSNGRYVLLLNSDTVVLDGAIQKTVEFADAHPEAAVVGCRVLNPDRTLQRVCFMYPWPLNLFLYASHANKIWPRSRFFGRERMTWWDFDEVREVDTVCGCFAMVRQTAIDDVGLMDEMYFVYGDDPDWCIRFERQGWKRLFFPDAQIIHFGGQTTKKMPNKFIHQKAGSILLFNRLHGSRLRFPIARLWYAMFFLLRAPYWLLAALFRGGDRQRCLAMARIYFSGGFYCLFDWTRLVMNREVMRAGLRERGWSRGATG